MANPHELLIRSTDLIFFPKTHKKYPMKKDADDSKFGVFGIFALALGIASIFTEGMVGIFVAFVAVIAGIVGSRKRERFSLAGVIIAAVVLIFLNLQAMGVIPTPIRNADLMRGYTETIRASAKVFKAVKAEATAKTQGKKDTAREDLLQAIDKSLTAARKLDAKRFDPFIPGFSRHFRDEFIAGMTHLKTGYSQNSKVERAKGAVLLDKWGLWSRDNRDKLVKLWHKWHPQPSLFRTLVKK